ncbi:MAG: hypothetical protein ACUVYA_03810 [Planctomycetota bacterium]
MTHLARIQRFAAPLALASALAAGSALSAHGAEAPKDVREILERMGEPPADEEPMPPEVRANFIDKVRIAEEREQRVAGLKEQGNPHFSPGVLLEGAAPDPERSRVDTDALRERLIRLVERRGEASSARVGGGEARPSGPGAAPGAAPAPHAGAPGSKSVPRPLVWIFAALAAGLAAVLAYGIARRRG